MKSISKKVLLIISCIILIMGFTTIVDADSGWDYDYDYDYDAGYDYDDDYDYDSSWSSSSSSGSHTGESNLSYEEALALAIITLIIFYFIMFRILGGKTSFSLKSKKVPKIKKAMCQVVPSKANQYEDLSDHSVKVLDPTLDKEELKKETFEIYKQVQTAWMDFNYDTLRDNLTDELYNMYHSQLNVLKVKKQQNIMKEIRYIDSKITDIKIENDIETVEIYLNVEQYDYVTDENNKVVRGVDTVKNNVEYIITFTRSMKNTTNTKCPGCGAEIDIVSGGTCPYCRSIIVTKTNKLVMSKKECINQRRM